MQIYIMDSDYEVMKNLESFVTVRMKSKAKCFTNCRQLTEAAIHDQPNAVMIDYDTKNGPSAVKTIRSECPFAKIIIMSADKNKAIDYFSLDLEGFLLKPIDGQQLEKQLFGIKHPILAKLTPNKERAAIL